MLFNMIITFLFVALVTVVPTLVTFFGRIINNTKGPIPAVPIIDEDDNNKSIGSTASGNGLVAPSTTRTTVNKLPAASYGPGFRRTKDRGRMAAKDAPKNLPKKCYGTGLPPHWNKDLSTIPTPRWNAFRGQKKEPQPIQPKWINSLTAPPRTLFLEPWDGKMPFITGPATEEIANVLAEDHQDQKIDLQQPFYSGPATEEEIDAVFAEDDLDMDFFVIGTPMEMDWNAKPKSVAAAAASEATLLGSSSVAKKSILKKPGDQKEDSRTSHRRSVAWGQDEYQEIRHNWIT